VEIEEAFGEDLGTEEGGAGVVVAADVVAVVVVEKTRRANGSPSQSWDDW